METPIAPTTELEAVNLMLGAIGNTPATSLEAPSVDVQQAQDLLRQMSVQVQTGSIWNFNSEDDYPLTPNEDGEIVLPANIHSVVVDPLKNSGCLDIVTRGSKLYDRYSHSTKFTTTTIKANIVLLLEFEDLPQPARNYITTLAARVFQDQTEGSQDNHTFTSQDEQRAWIGLKNYEANTGRYSLKKSPDTARRLRRY